MVAGMIEEGESPEGVARREGSQKPGLMSAVLSQSPEVTCSPGGASEKLASIMVGEVDATRRQEGIHGLADENGIFVYPCE